MMDSDIELGYTKSVDGVGIDINLLEEEHKPPGCNHKKSQHSKLCEGCEKKKTNKDDEPKKNACPHCK